MTLEQFEGILALFFVLYLLLRARRKELGLKDHLDPMPWIRKNIFRNDD